MSYETTEKRRAYKHEYYIKHKAEIVARTSKWRHENRNLYLMQERERERKRREKDPEGMRRYNAEKARKYRENHRELVRERDRKRWAENPRYKESHSRSAKHGRENLKHTIMDSVGGPKCKRCGYNSDIRALQLDHIHGGGGKEWREIGGHYKAYVYYANHPEEAKAKLQVLCANCNAIKKHEHNLIK